jgi:hypothetical protein
MLRRITGMIAGRCPYASPNARAPAQTLPQVIARGEAATSGACRRRILDSPGSAFSLVETNSLGLAQFI